MILCSLFLPIEYSLAGVCIKTQSISTYCVLRNLVVQILVFELGDLQLFILLFPLLLEVFVPIKEHVSHLCELFKILLLLDDLFHRHLNLVYASG